MAPKQKMGSITHNSTEVNKPKKGGLFSKLKGSMTDGGSKTKTQQGINKSFTSQQQQQQQPMKRSFTSARNDQPGGGVDDGFSYNGDAYSTFDDGIPKSILALPPDMPADEVSEAGMTNPTMAPQHHMYPTQRSQMRSSANRGGGPHNRSDSGSAQRALENLSMSRKGSMGSNYTGSRRGSVESMQSHGRSSRRSSNEDGVYSRRNNSRDDYDDVTGGGVFDQQYMQSGYSVSSQQPPPPERQNYRKYGSGGDSYPSGSASGPSVGSGRRRATIAGSSNQSQRSNGSRSEASMRHSVGHAASSQGNSYVVNNGINSDHSTPSHRSKGSVPSMPAFKEENPPWFREDDNNQLRSSSNSGGSGGRWQQQDFDDDDMTMATMSTKANALKPSSMNKAKVMSAPYGEVTIVYTDVQGSTSLWESCPSAMKEAQDIHDIIMRQCYSDHKGYEITTEGDAFNLAFQHPVDALAFALQCQQKLYQADWPKGILDHPDGKDEANLKFRGFRVRFGIHHGPTTSRIHENTGRTVYSGEGVKIAKAIEGMCHGGQILTSMETWKAVSGMAERYLGRPQILDCGEHLLFESKVPNQDNSGYTTTRYARRIMQLVPTDLAFDFFEARGRRDVPNNDGGPPGYEIKDSSLVKGRLFPPLISKRQLTTSFLNAPYANGRVTICFVYTVGLDDNNPDNRAPNLKKLAKHLRKQLLVLNPPGYECQEDAGCWMLAFDRMAHAVTFGLNLKSAMTNAHDLLGDVNYENMFKVGILSGPFTAMGPHKTTGMADYFGPIVNRAARVASNCEPGQVCVGIALSNGVTADPPDFGPTVNVNLLEIKKLKGITIDVAIFQCSKRRIETLR